MYRDEKSYWEQVNDKQASGFKELYQSYFPALTKYAYNIIFERKAAEDIIQEIFINIWKGTILFNSEKHLKGYLYTSVKNACFNFLNSQKAENNHRKKYSKLYHEAEDSGELLTIEEEQFRLLYEALNTLPRRRREIAYLAIKGLKNKEIARELNLSLSTVETQRKYYIRDIRKRFRIIDFIVIYFLIHLK